MAWVYGIDPAQGGAVAVLVVVVVLILMGLLVPRRTMVDRVADKLAQIRDLTAERDAWRAAHRVSEEARGLAQDQVRQLLEVTRTTDRVLTAISSPQAGQGVNARALDPSGTPAP